MTIENKQNKVTLYIATHNTTGLKYFGKTTRYFTEIDLQENYHGSGTYWTNHLKKHGNDVTMEIYGVYSKTDVEQIALKFSKDNNIVDDYNLWANMKEENGLDGGTTKEATKKMLETRKANMSYISAGKKLSITKSKKDNNGKSIFQKASEKSAETMIKNGTYIKNGIKSSKTRMLKGLSKGMKNPKAKLIHIFDKNDNLVYVCKGNSREVCRVNNLPFNRFHSSWLNNSKRININKIGLNPDYYNANKQYNGWYAKEIK